jgi:hypothetical protein
MSADGTWNITTNTPMGSQDATLTLTTDGSALSGQMSGQQGTLDITDGTVDGESLSWKTSLTQPMPIDLVFSATVDGDNISGTVELGSFGNATFSGTRS